MKIDDTSPDNSDLLSLTEIRWFFNKRSWLRPRDWASINAVDPMPVERQRHLTAYIRGYFEAKR